MPSSHDDTSLELSPDASRRLDAALASWAGAARLGDEGAESVRRSIVSANQDLGFDWWWTFLKNMGLVEREPAAEAGGHSVMASCLDLALRQAVPGWDAPLASSAGFQPYLAVRSIGKREIRISKSETNPRS